MISTHAICPPVVAMICGFIVLRYRLDEDAKSKLREIIEKRAEDKNEILVPWRLTRERWELWRRVVALFQGMKRGRMRGKDWFLICFVAFLCYVLCLFGRKSAGVVRANQIEVCRASMVGGGCKCSG